MSPKRLMVILNQRHFMRTATIDRKTGETDIHLTLALDGRGRRK